MLHIEVIEVFHLVCIHKYNIQNYPLVNSHTNTTYLHIFLLSRFRIEHSFKTLTVKLLNNLQVRTTFLVHSQQLFLYILLIYAGVDSVFLFIKCVNVFSSSITYFNILNKFVIRRWIESFNKIKTFKFT